MAHVMARNGCSCSSTPRHMAISRTDIKRPWKQAMRRRIRCLRARRAEWQSARHCVMTNPAGLRPAVSGDRRRALWKGIARMDGIVSTAGSSDGAARTLPGGGQRASGARGSDGSTLGSAGDGAAAGRPRFDADVPSGGYRWWYLDALSDDGRHGLTIIGFVGSVFSPYYAFGRGGAAVPTPQTHCAINVALYGKSGHRWTHDRARHAAASPAMNRTCHHRWPEFDALGRWCAGHRHQRDYRAAPVPLAWPGAACTLGALCPCRDAGWAGPASLAAGCAARPGRG